MGNKYRLPRCLKHHTFGVAFRRLLTVCKYLIDPRGGYQFTDKQKHTCVPPGLPPKRVNVFVESCIPYPVNIISRKGLS